VTFLLLHTLVGLSLSAKDDDGSSHLDVLEHTLLEKRSFVSVANPHLYWVSNRYRPSSTNVKSHLYRVSHPLQI
jgi:hypothetical protein